MTLPYGPSDSASIAMSITMDTSQAGKALLDFEQKAQASSKAAADALVGLGDAAKAAALKLQLMVHAGHGDFKILINDLDFLKQYLTQDGAALQELGKHFKTTWSEAKEGAKETADVVDQLGQSLKKLTIAGAGLMVLKKAWSALVGLVKDSVEEFSQFTIANFKLEVGIRASQRLIGEAAGSTEEWTGFIKDLREQFQIFSTRDLTAAAAKVLLLTRELGFNKKQMQEVTKASIILAEVSGFKVEEAARRLTLFLDTGYTRGLAQLGLQISKTQVEQYAFAQGIEKTWNEMSRAERAAVSLGVVLEQTGRLADDAGRIIETFGGQLMALEAAQADAMLATGENAGFLVLAWERIKTFVIVNIIPRFVDEVKKLAKRVINSIAEMIVPISTFAILMGKLFTDPIATMKDFGTAVEESFAAATEIAEGFVAQLDNELFPAMSELGNVTDDSMGMFAEGLDEGAKALKSFEEVTKETLEKLKNEWDKFVDRSADALLRLERAIEDLNTSFAYKLIDAARGLGFKLVDINQKFADRRETAWRKYYDDIAMLSWKTNNKIAEAQADFRYDELKEQREFDLEMERMQRKYLFDLEDAIRERDARAVLNIMRRFQEDQRQAGEDFELGKLEREEALQQEIAGIRRAEEIRRMELKRSLDLRLRDLEIQRLRERAASRENYQRELNEIAENEKRRRADIKKTYDQRIADLKAHWEEFKKELALELIESYDMTKAGVDALLAELNKFFGGATAQFTSFITTLRNAMAQAQAAISVGAYSYYDMIAGIRARGASGISGAGVGTPVGFATGGGMVASKPTTATFGEAGPELGSFIPLNKLGQVLGGAGGGTKIELTVKAEDGFYVEVADQVMGEMAEVIVNTERGR